MSESRWRDFKMKKSRFKTKYKKLFQLTAAILKNNNKDVRMVFLRDLLIHKLNHFIMSLVLLNPSVDLVDNLNPIKRTSSFRKRVDIDKRVCQCVIVYLAIKFKKGTFSPTVETVFKFHRNFLNSFFYNQI